MAGPARRHAPRARAAARISYSCYGSVLKLLRPTDVSACRCCVLDHGAARKVPANRLRLCAQAMHDGLCQPIAARSAEWKGIVERGRQFLAQSPTKLRDGTVQPGLGRRGGNAEHVGRFEDAHLFDDAEDE